MKHSGQELPSISRLPLASRDTYEAPALAHLHAIPKLREALRNDHFASFLHAVSEHSPFLARLMTKYPDQLYTISQNYDTAWHSLVQEFSAQTDTNDDPTTCMLRLRHFKARVALTVGLADLSGRWALAQTTRALSDFAQSSVCIALRYLLQQAVLRGDFAPQNRNAPEIGSGIVVLGMGKLGAYELNYSSDIDLIVLFEKEHLPYCGARNPQIFMNKLVGDLVNLLQERTPEGYVFRADLRLRPDPMSTPLAITTAAALSYYETVGQNWERAAMIKARPIAGDMEAGARYLQELVPYVWRKALDFAAIADIHSIKRQMNVKVGKTIELLGHNIKIGMGGIREIEFFVQTQQLVWGGRIPELRVRPTCEALALLTKYELCTPETRDQLTLHYHWLRSTEHRLQMRNDEQTHTLPSDSEELNQFSRFLGYSTAKAFETECLSTLKNVHAIYTDSMMDSAPLAVDGNLVFTGVEADPDTLETLARLGYTETRRISDIIQGWHRGHRRSTRSKRSRQVLTELVPALLIALGKTANPDAAFFHFDDFIDRLPSGAQIFSLFLSRPEMLEILADILGSAPALGDTLSNNPSLLDSVLEADFFLGLPNKEELENLVIERLRFAHSFEQKMIYLRTFNNEKRFQAGVHLLKQLANPKRVGGFLSDIAEIILQCTLVEVWSEYTKSVPPLANAHIPMAVLALGKLGGREMTFGSDLDIILLYDMVDAASDLRMHLTRMAQRFLSALTLLTREGRLYEVDTRLRPGGADGPLAISLEAFDGYFSSSAWTYEHMALTRARVVATNTASFAKHIESVVRAQVLKSRDKAILLNDVLEMRERIAKQFPTQNPWALKHIRGGMVDLDFIAQYVILRDASAHPALWQRSARQVFEVAYAEHLLDPETVASLIEAKKFLSDLMSLLRLSAPGGLITDNAPIGLKNLLVTGMRAEHFDALKARTLMHQENVRAAFTKMANAQL